MINALVDLVANFYRAGDMVHVEGIAHSLLAALPGDPVSLQFLGLVYYRTGRSGSALRLFRQASGRIHDLFAGYAGGGHHAGSDCAAADLCYRAATRRSADLAELWCDLGRVLAEVGERSLAIAAFRSALVACPGFSPAIAALGDVDATEVELAPAVVGRLSAGAQPDARPVI